MPVKPYGEEWIPRVANRLVHKCAEALLIHGTLTRENYGHLKWSDVFDFPASDLYGFENVGGDLLLHLKDGRMVSYNNLMERLGNGQLKPS